MTTILVPYHLDERRDGLVDGPVDVTITVDLPDGDVWSRMAAIYERVAGEVQRAESPVVVSGDCTTVFGTVAGLQRRSPEPFTIVWFDAHGDVQSLETTTSGYIGGMPLRMLVGYRPDLMADRLGIRVLDEAEAVLVEARDLDPAEVEFLDSSRIRRYDIQNLSIPEGRLLVHLDADVIDAEDLPGLLYPVPGGPSLGAVVAKVREIIATGRVVALDLACTWRSGSNPAARKLVESLTKGSEQVSD